VLSAQAQGCDGHLFELDRPTSACCQLPDHHDRAVGPDPCGPFGPHAVEPRPSWASGPRDHRRTWMCARS